MQFRFDIENDVSILRNENFNYDYYLDSFLEVFIEENNKEFSLFSTTMHSTIIIDLSEKLIELYKTGKKQILDPFGNANIYTFEKVSNNITITNFDKFSNLEEWKYSFNFSGFIKAYIKELKRYLNTMVTVEADIINHPNYILLRDGLGILEEICNKS